MVLREMTSRERRRGRKSTKTVITRVVCPFIHGIYTRVCVFCVTRVFCSFVLSSVHCSAIEVEIEGDDDTVFI